MFQINTQYIKFCLVISLAFLGLWPHLAQADLGPKPTMGFNFIYDTPLAGVTLSIGSAKLMQCDDPACTSAQPLQDAGPQNFRCISSACGSMAYGYADYQQLVVTFSDGSTRTSNVFSPQGMNSNFVVRVRSNDLLVRSAGAGPFLPVYPTSRHGGLWLAFGVTLISELAVLCAIMAARPRLRKKSLLYAALAANIVSLPILWGASFVLSIMVRGNPTLLLEIAVTLFEAFIIFIANKKTVSPKTALALSVAMNATSFALGFFI